MFWMRNKKNNFPICTLIWRPALISLPIGKFFMLFFNFLSSADYFQNKTFSKNSFRNTIRVSNSLDILSGLIWVQTVCEGYQQTTQVGNNEYETLKSYTFNVLI